MPRVRLDRRHIVIPSKYLLVGMSVFCILLMIVTYTTDVVSAPLSLISGYTIVPFQEGLTSVGTYLTGRADDLKQLRIVMEQNDALEKRVAELEIENSNLIQDKYELNELRQLYELDQKYSGYEKVGARVISKDPGNWFASFTIDKGEKDGILKDMNVMSGSGLVGIVTQVGPNWASVRSIIDDKSNVSAQVLSTQDNLIVTGDLAKIEQGQIVFSQLVDDDNEVVEGDQLVTSDISDKYLPGINIGYISSVGTDSNNLTKSGTVTPAVDFEHLDVVLVIKQLKADINK